ncbi:MAG TPA: recombinase family protein [Oscillospiraceae bacterium]|nr:recombinase family protein [Oscillospiraceae bacterium]
MQRTIRKMNPTGLVIPKKTRVAAYARVSSGKDAMLHSLSAQVSYYSNYIQKHPGWEYVGTYADEALTGTKDNRAEFQRLLLDCRAGKVDMIITKSISRFTRNTLTLLETVRELKTLGIDVLFEKENLHSMSGDGELMLTILASFAQEESRSVSENCKWRIRKQFQAGEPANWRFLFGYHITKDSVEIDTQQAEIVRMIFHDYLAGDGMDRIAKKLSSMGIQKTFSGKWTAPRVMEILKNEKYTGNALLQKAFVADHLAKKKTRNHGELPMYYAEGTNEAIIDLETFERVQELIETKRMKNNSSKKTPARYPLTGKIVCMNCGNTYRRKVCRTRANWQCNTYLRSGRGDCPAKQIPEETLLVLTAKVLDLPQFDEEVFYQKISLIQVTGPNQLTFLFKDGHSEYREWRDRSRSESWNAEARKKASEQQKEYIRRERAQ